MKTGRLLTFFGLGFLGARVLLNSDILSGIMILCFMIGLALWLNG